MHRNSSRWRIILAAAVSVLAFGMLVGVGASATPSPTAIELQHVCGSAAPGFASCHAIRVLNPSALVRPTARPTKSTTTTTATPSSTTVPPYTCTTTHAGYTPCDLQSAYQLPSATAGSGQTVAIVDAYDDPSAESDLGVYRSSYGLPPCTTANGCFHKVNQSGGTSYPRRNTGWAEEISLDLDMVSATCPNCHILLVEASSNSLTNLAAAFRQAASTSGVVAVSNSYGGGDSSADVTLDGPSYYNFVAYPKVAVTASSGDSGYGVEYPAASPYVTAVGGTSLYRDSSAARGWTETVWNNSSGAPGSGCSAYEAQPLWQSLGLKGCSGRMVADVSAVADPYTGVAVYDTYGVSGWLVFGGTSVASPIVASVYALAGNAASVIESSYPYSHISSLNDVTSGNNGTCSPAYLCTAETGYDGPTGLGTPNGTGAF